MDIADYGISPSVDPLMKQLEEFDLLKHALELEAYGLTIVPKEKLGVSADFGERLHDAILRTCEKRNGVEIGDCACGERGPGDLLISERVLVEVLDRGTGVDRSIDNEHVDGLLSGEGSVFGTLNIRDEHDRADGC